ncbi:MAG: small multi-drug export protein [Treponema sp.]|nr:small multi-drug export protein [Candidatus Treponema equi]
MLTKYLIVFLISMVPLIELRGAIPVSQGFELPVLQSYILCIVGNMLPVPFIHLFARKFLEWGQDKKFIGGICTFFLVKGKRAGEKLESKAGRGLFVALFLFVGIPLPGTGAWTGTLAASLLDMKFKETVIAVMSGVLLAGIIMMALSFGVVTVAS